MRIISIIAALLLAATAPDFPAAAQQQDSGGSQEQGTAVSMPPSAAVKLAMEAMPGAKPLGVKLKGGIYVVRLKQDGSITLVGVDPETGEVFPLQ